MGWKDDKNSIGGGEIAAAPYRWPANGAAYDTPQEAGRRWWRCI